jgi:hypothetical protein
MFTTIKTELCLKKVDSTGPRKCIYGNVIINADIFIVTFHFMDVLTFFYWTPFPNTPVFHYYMKH